MADGPAIFGHRVPNAAGERDQSTTWRQGTGQGVRVWRALFLPPAATATDTRFVRLSRPSIVAIVRHAHAPGTGDSTRFMLDDCTTQRNLDVRGGEQAREIGAAIHVAGVTVDRVLTS